MGLHLVGQAHAGGRWLGFTRPYVKVPSVLVTRRGPPWQHEMDLRPAAGQGRRRARLCRRPCTCASTGLPWTCKSWTMTASASWPCGPAASPDGCQTWPVPIPDAGAAPQTRWSSRPTWASGHDLCFAFSKVRPQIGEALDRALNQVDPLRKQETEALDAHRQPGQPLIALRTCRPALDGGHGRRRRPGHQQPVVGAPPSVPASARPAMSRPASIWPGLLGWSAARLAGPPPARCCRTRQASSRSPGTPMRRWPSG